MAKIESLKEAKVATKEAKANIKEAKAALATYYKENKLKKTEDYSKDKKHSKKISRLETAIEKAEAGLVKIQETTKELKAASGGRTKYDYPEDIDTPEKRKKYRQEQRAAAKKAAKGEAPAKTKKSKAKGKAEEPAETTKAKAKGKPKATKKAKKKKVVKTEDD